jgi:hypothetical protein
MQNGSCRIWKISPSSSGSFLVSLPLVVNTCRRNEASTSCILETETFTVHSLRLNLCAHEALLLHLSFCCSR